MHALDTPTKLHASKDSATQEGVASIEARSLKDGGIELTATQSTKKTTGKAWNTQTVLLCLDADQKRILRELLA